jgi:beta-lactamase class A
MKCLILVLFFVVLFIIPTAAQSPILSELPFSIPDNQIRPLRQLVNKDLQRLLEKRLRQDRVWARLIGKKRMAVGVVDLSNPQQIKFARVNGDVMMYAASLPKLAILLATCQSLQDGVLKETPEILHDMRLMISRSDNAASTRLYDSVGFEKIEKVLTDPRYQLYDSLRGGGLWVGKRYAKTGKRYPDPVMGFSHGATVTQVCRYYYLLAMGKLVNRERSIQMLEMLSDPELHHKFVNTLDHIAPEAKLYRKSGTWHEWHSDSVLVWGLTWRRYICVGLIEDGNGETILRNLIPVVEDVLKSRSAP